jgi:ABC-2 type transport system permease protein
MRILDLTLKDLSQIFRDKRTLLFLIAMPIVFTLFMGFAYKSGDDNTPTDIRIPLGWVNKDPDGLLSRQLYTMLSNSDSVKLVELQPEALDEAVRKGEVAGVLLVPQGFNTLLNTRQQPLTLVVDSASTNGQSLFQLIKPSVTQLFSSVEIARLSAEAVGKPDDTVEIEVTFTAAAQAWQETDSNSLVKVEMALAEPEQAWYGDNPYNQASPGILVQFAIFGLVTSGQLLVQERKSRTLQRMMTTSLRPWQIVTGHTLAMFAVVFVQEALLVVFGQFVLGVNYGGAPFGILLVSIALGLWIAAMGLLIGVLAKDDSQVVLFSLLAMFLFSAMGGTWFPLETTSGAFAVIGKAMPSAWAMNGLQNILIRGLGSASAWLPTGILVAYAAGFFLLAVWCFRKMEI